MRKQPFAALTLGLALALPLSFTTLSHADEFSDEALARQLLTEEDMQEYTTAINEAATEEERRLIQEAFHNRVTELAKERGVEMSGGTAKSGTGSGSGSVDTQTTQVFS